MDIRRIVGRNIRTYRLRAGISQEELAGRMGVEQGYVSRLEAGSRNPTVSTIAEAANALGVSAADLLRIEVLRAKRVRVNSSPRRRS